jgi:hypothetical protein
VNDAQDRHFRSSDAHEHDVAADWDRSDIGPELRARLGALGKVPEYSHACKGTPPKPLSGIRIFCRDVSNDLFEVAERGTSKDQHFKGGAPLRLLPQVAATHRRV